MLRSAREYQPYPKQQQFIEAVFSRQYDTLIYGGAMGGGKTFVLVLVLMLLCRAFPGSRWIVIRRSMPDIERTILKDWQAIYDSNYFERTGQRPDVTYTARNGSQVIFMAENFDQDKDLNRFKSLAASGFVFEQVEEIQEKTYEMAHLRAGRLRIDPMPPRLIMATINPTPQWPKERFYEPHRGGTLPDNVYFLEALINDNPTLYEDADYMSGLDNLDPMTGQRMIEGDWSAFPVDKPFAYCFDSERHIVKSLDIDYRLPIYLSFDFNVDPIVCLIAQHGNKWIRIPREYRIENSNLFELIKRLRAELQEREGPRPRLYVTGDASGKSRHATSKYKGAYDLISKELGVRMSQMRGIFGANPQISETHTVLNGILANYPEFFISLEGCPYLIEDLEQVEYTEGFCIDKGRDKRQSHLLDALRYYLYHFHRDWWRKSK
jgi:hypothetical protein